MLSEAFLDGDIPVGRCVGIEHPNIQKGPLESPSPKTIDGYVQSGPIGGVVGTSRQLLSGPTPAGLAQPEHHCRLRSVD